jgi:hypothetical protein
LGEAGPVEFYIGNTVNRADEKTIEMVLKKCAEHLEGSEGFDVMEVELLTKEEKPRTKCWRVMVPYKYREMMEMDEMYPMGWKHRKFFGTRKSNAKKARTDNDSETVVEQALKQQERERTMMEQRQEEERNRLINEQRNLEAQQPGHGVSSMSQ